MKKIIFNIIIFSLLISGCTNIDELKSKPEIRSECREKYRESFEDRKECANKICEELDLEWRGSGSWYYSTEKCDTESGASIDVELCNTNLESCKRVCNARIQIQYCSDDLKRW